MGFRLKTSSNTKDIFEYLGTRTNLKPFVLSKIAISLSLKEEDDISNYVNDDINGFELNRQTITGQYDEVFKCLMEAKAGRYLSDDEYFPEYTKKHLDRGAEILKNLYDYRGNFERLFNSLLKGSEGI
ncbi:DndE family protein [Tissierella carlieri]|uniref:DndE family protein n=1 Tax=Tissierella carlieri TaxID=689904 RepID=UPI001C0FA163|nr:DndE family protein [Tissierella carlieri]MBU5310595.1 DndE family protein [Tissierella carlieri]